MTEFKFELGEEVEDIITGLKGYIVGRCEHITGCNTYGIIGRKKKTDGDYPASHWLDEPRLIKTGRKLKGMPERTTETRQANKQGAMGVPASSRSHP